VRSLSHLATTLAPLRSVTGCAAVHIMAATAFLSFLLDGAVGRSVNETPGRMNGTTGHFQGLVGFGDSGSVPSFTLMPGKLAKRLSGLSANSAAPHGKMMMVNTITIPLRPSDVSDK